MIRFSLLRPPAARRWLRAGAACLAAGLSLRAADLADLLAERVRSCVTVEFLVENELDRQPVAVPGVVIDTEGTIVLPASAVDSRIPVSRLRDFKVYRPDSSVPYAAEYLGQDALTGWHFVRAEAKLRPELVPLTAWVRPGTPAPRLADEVWGIGLRGKDEDFRPYFLMSRVALIERLPQQTAIAASEVASPSLPVFNRDGAFVGLALNSFGQNYLMFSRQERGASVVLVNVEESSVFLQADEVLPYLGRVPRNVAGRPLPWLGIFGLEPVDPDVARFLKLEDQSALVVSEALEDSPAERAGLQARDVIVALDGRPLPRFKPDQVVATYVERMVAARRPGDEMVVTVLRGGRRLDFKVTLGDEPKIIREADRRYFEHLGLTVREFLYGDAVVRRIKQAQRSGVIVEFVKSNSPAAMAGLEPDDWIREIDGRETKTYAEAVGALAAIEADQNRSEFVVLTSRGGETAVRRVKLR